MDQGRDSQAAPDRELMPRREREDLIRLTRQRERLAKATVDARAAALRADFEAQMATLYAWDQDDVWRRARETADAAVQVAQASIDARCAELGIPKEFRPGIHGPYWSSRGESATTERRTELRKVAETRLVAMAKDAKRSIEAASLEVQTRLLAAGLTSGAAMDALAAMPTAEMLMPPLAVADITALAGRRGRGIGRW